VCPAPQNGKVDCGSGLVNMGLVGNDCEFTCDTGYILQENFTNGTCESTGNWNTGLPSCKLQICKIRNKMIQQSGAIVLPSPSCSLLYWSNCTVSCQEGFIGDDVTYSVLVQCNKWSYHSWLGTNRWSECDMWKRFVYNSR